MPLQSSVTISDPGATVLRRTHERLGATVERRRAERVRHRSVFPVVELGARLSMTHLDGTGDENLVVNTTAFLRVRPPTQVSSTSTWLGRPPILSWLGRPSRAELVENLKGRLVARKTKVPLKLHGGHAASDWRPDKRPRPDVQRSVATLHHCSHRQPGVLAALAAAQDARAVFKVERLSRRAQCGQAKPSPRAFSR